MQQATASHENSAAINAMRWPSMRTTYGRLLRNDLTITELWQKITAHGIKAGRATVARFLLHLQLTFKKKTLHAAEQERPDVKDARAAWREMQKSLDPQRLVFIDETWASTNMTPRYGRCERGKRLIAHTPFGHWKTTTFL